MKTKLILAALSALAISFNVVAEEANTTKASASDIELQDYEGSNDNPVGWVPFAAAGVSAVEFDRSLTNRDGFAGNARVIGSYYNQSRNFVYDLGLGLDSAELDETTVNSGLAELAARYRLGKSKKWSLGPVANFNLGKNVGVEYGSTADNIATFAGAQVVRDFAIGEQSMLRAGVKALTDIGIHNSNVNKFLFELQLGAVPGTTVKEAYVEKKAEMIPAVEEVQEVEEVAIVKPAAAVEEIAPVVEKINFETFMAPASIFFTTDTKNIGARNQKVINELTTILNANKDKIKEINVYGFADQRGADAYNQILSEKRAQTVLKELQSAGLNLEKINAVGKGEVADNDLKFARRVDIEIVGVKETELLDSLKALNKIQ